MLQLKGYSDIAPEKHLKKALDMHLRDVKGDLLDGTTLIIECDQFEKTIKGLQLDAFKPQQEVLQLTPMALVINSFHAALDKEIQDTELDKPLLRSLMNFKKNFVSDNEIVYLANRGTIPEVKLTKDIFEQIEILEERIPEPQNILINGQLDEMKISKGRLGLKTEEGMVNLIVKEDTVIRELLDYMGKDITIKGKAHYKVNGSLSFVEIHEFNTPGVNDTYFSSIPNAKNVQQQLFAHAKTKTKSNSFEALRNLSGLMKEDLSDDEFKEMIKDAHK
jgi:hypothetical protein